MPSATIFPSTTRPVTWYFPSSFLSKLLSEYLNYPFVLHAPACHHRRNVWHKVDNMTPLIYALRTFLHVSLKSSILGTDIIPNTVLSNTVSPFGVIDYLNLVYCSVLKIKTKNTGFWEQDWPWSSGKSVREGQLSFTR